MDAVVLVDLEHHGTLQRMGQHHPQGTDHERGDQHDDRAPIETARR